MRDEVASLSRRALLARAIASVAATGVGGIGSGCATSDRLLPDYCTALAVPSLRTRYPAATSPYVKMKKCKLKMSAALV